jgi:hypothetical protein
MGRIQDIDKKITNEQYEYFTRTTGRIIANGDDVAHHGCIFCVYDLATNAKAEKGQGVHGKFGEGKENCNHWRHSR